MKKFDNFKKLWYNTRNIRKENFMEYEDILCDGAYHFFAYEFL